MFVLIEGATTIRRSLFMEDTSYVDKNLRTFLRCWASTFGSSSFLIELY